MQKIRTPKPLPIRHSFPPQRDYSSLSVHDLLDARDAYHVYLASLEHVVATAIGRYRIHRDDWYATHPPDTPRPNDYPKIEQPRTLSNSIVRTSAWKVGKGNSIDPSELVAFSEEEIENIYRHESNFVPSLSLKRMAQSGDFEPPP